MSSVSVSHSNQPPARRNGRRRMLYVTKKSKGVFSGRVKGVMGEVSGLPTTLPHSSCGAVLVSSAGSVFCGRLSKRQRLMQSGHTMEQETFTKHASTGHTDMIKPISDDPDEQKIYEQFLKEVFALKINGGSSYMSELDRADQSLEFAAVETT